MSEMVKRVANAMFEAAWPNEKSRRQQVAWNPATLEAYEGLARVAIEAMREPTDIMVRHGEGYSDFTLPPEIGDTRDDLRREMKMAYTAMIDASLPPHKDRQMSDDKRPEWTHDIDEETVRWLAAGFVVRIEHRWEMTGVDTSRSWLVFHRGKVHREFPTNFLNVGGYFEFKPNWRELVAPTWKGDQAVKTLEEIDAWEKKNRAERAQFERLKAKFGDAVSHSSPAAPPST